MEMGRVLYLGSNMGNLLGLVLWIEQGKQKSSFRRSVYIIFGCKWVIYLAG
jgi:hypothetical protein